MLSSWIQLLFALLFAFCLKRILFHLSDPLRVVPGPFLARFSRLWYLIDTYRGRSHETIERLHNKYGTRRKISG